MPAIFSTIGRAALALGKRAVSAVGSRLFAKQAASTALNAEELAATQLKRLALKKQIRKSKALDFARWVLGQSSQGEEEPKTLAQREEAMVNHMSIWLVIGLTIFFMYSFFTNVISNAPIPSGAL